MTIVPSDSNQPLASGEDGSPASNVRELSGTFAVEVQSIVQAVCALDPVNADRYSDVLYNIGDRTWFSQEHENLAQTAFHGMRAAVTNERVEYLQFLYGTLAELYLLDRALHAASLIKVGEPIRRSELPITASMLCWQQGVFSTLPAIVILLENEIPDQLLTVPRINNRILQGLEVYAEYGSTFCVKVAEIKL